MNKTFAMGLVAAAILAGCEAKPSVFPSSDPALQLTSAQYAAEAVKHFPFKTNLSASSEQPVRALVEYSFDFMDLTNLSKQDIPQAEVWINRQYVLALPAIKSGEVKRLNFRMFFDDKGDHFPFNNNVEKGGVIIRQLEVVSDGKIYEVPIRLGL